MPYSEQPVSAAAGHRSRTRTEMGSLAVGDLDECDEAARSIASGAARAVGYLCVTRCGIHQKSCPLIRLDGTAGRLLAGAGLCTNEGEQP
jgi:hypothetical protein